MARTSRKRPPQYRSNEAFRRMVVRMINSYAQRVITTGTDEDIAALVALTKDTEAAVAKGIHGLRAQRFSWSTIATAIGTSRQNCEKRWGRGERPAA